MRLYQLLFALGVFLMASPAALFSQELLPTELRTEHRVDPLGITRPHPRLSWILTSERRNEVQTGYQVQVASSGSILKEGIESYWDTGRIKSSETLDILYGGEPLNSGDACFWRVRVWDGDGEVSSWSEPASWTMGLMAPKDWKAEWIGLDRIKGEHLDPVYSDFEQSQWIWYPEGNPSIRSPVGTCYFRGSMPGLDAPVKKASLAISVDNEFTVWIDGREVGKGNNFKVVSVFDVTRFLSSEKNVIAVSAHNAGNDPNPAAFAAWLRVELEDGSVSSFSTSPSWKVTRKPQEGWFERDFDDSTWKLPMLVGDMGDEPWGDLSPSELTLPPPRYLRGEFNLGKKIRRAFVHATALGIFELRLNGKRVGSDFFNPGWTDYDKRVYTRTYDVAHLLRAGKNAMGIILADGWYAGYIGYGRNRNHYGKDLRFLGQIQVEFEDGSSEVIGTGSDFKGTTGPILESDFLMGETYDARKELDRWDEPGYEGESEWAAVDISEPGSAVVEAHPGPPVQAFAELPAVAITEPEPGRFVFDLGQNFAGVIRLRIQAEAGTELTLRFAERLAADGNVYVENLRSARTVDTYICRGGGVEIWQPRFTYHGFQYVELTGYPGRPTEDVITGIALGSATELAGEMETSDDTVNKLLSNIYWTQRANFIDVPTDCPQRDERLGWTGDAQVYCRTACFNADVQAFMTKWLIDLSDAQRADGQFPMVAPLKVAGDDGGPAWADAGVICPWVLYDVYGDRDLLSRHYSGMVRFVDFCASRSPDFLPPEDFHCFGDWVNIEADTPKEVIYSAYFARSVDLLARSARVVGKVDDAQKYEELFQSVKNAFTAAYVSEQGKILGETQCAYVLALAYDLLPPETRRLAAKHLVADIEARKNRLSTGFVGTKDLMTALSKVGRTDVAYRLLHNKGFPSWGYSIERGATSIWERWNGWSDEDGFHDPGMNSFSHYAFGVVGQWLYETVAGIRSGEPGFEKIVISPQPGGDLTWVKARYRSVRGEIRVDWKTEDGRLSLDVEIPANTTALVTFPTLRKEDVTLFGLSPRESKDVEVRKSGIGSMIFEVGSGRYSFSGPYEGRSWSGK